MQGKPCNLLRFLYSPSRENLINNGFTVAIVIYGSVIVTVFCTTDSFEQNILND